MKAAAPSKSSNYHPSFSSLPTVASARSFLRCLWPCFQLTEVAISSRGVLQRPFAKGVVLPCWLVWSSIGQLYSLLPLPNPYLVLFFYLKFPNRYQRTDKCNTLPHCHCSQFRGKTLRKLPRGKKKKKIFSIPSRSRHGKRKDRKFLGHCKPKHSTVTASLAFILEDDNHFLMLATEKYTPAHHKCTARELGTAAPNRDLPTNRTLGATRLWAHFRKEENSCLQEKTKDNKHWGCPVKSQKRQKKQNTHCYLDSLT